MDEQQREAPPVKVGDIVIYVDERGREWNAEVLKINDAALGDLHLRRLSLVKDELN